MKVDKNGEGAKRSAIANAARWRKPTASGYLGDLVSWDFATNDGFRAPRHELIDMFERLGFDKAVERIDMGAALLLAPHCSVKRGRNIVVKTVDRHRKDTTACLGVYRKLTGEGEQGDDWLKGARVRIDLHSNEAIALPFEGQLLADPKCLEVADALAAKANELARWVTNNELSKALRAAGHACFWAKFRNKGGAWFVHADKAANLRTLLDEVERYGNFWANIQPIFVDNQGRSERNVAHAGKGMLESELERLRKDLSKAVDDGTMRDSTIEDRLRECDELLARADLYGSLLKEAADEIKKQTEQVKEQFRRALDAGEENDSFFDEIVDIPAMQCDELLDLDEIFADV